MYEANEFAIPEPREGEGENVGAVGLNVGAVGLKEGLRGDWVCVCPWKRGGVD